MKKHIWRGKIIFILCLTLVCIALSGCASAGTQATGESNRIDASTLSSGTEDSGSEQETVDVQEAEMGQETVNTENKSQEPVGYEPIPSEYKSPSNHQGTLQRLDYEYEGRSKHAYVYVPYGYDEGGTYDTLYLMHGGGCSAETYLGSDTNPNTLKTVVDNLIEKGDISPLLIVTPSFYPDGDTDSSVANAGSLVKEFPKELRNSLIPLVESKFPTYAGSTDSEDLSAKREHRAFGGFSMGSVTTWYVFAECLDLFNTFTPHSGDCWALGQMGGNNDPDGTAKYLADAVRDSGYSADDFQILAATGTEDIAFDALDPQINAMKKPGDVFAYSDRPGEGNLHYILAEGQSHDFSAQYDYAYDALKFFYGD